MNNKLFYTAGFTDMKPRLMHNATPFQVVPQEAQIPETPEAKEKKEAERKKNAADKVSLGLSNGSITPGNIDTNDYIKMDIINGFDLLSKDQKEQITKLLIKKIGSVIPGKNRMASVAYLDHHEFIESDPNKITVVATKISNTQGALKFTLNKPEGENIEFLIPVDTIAFQIEQTQKARNQKEEKPEEPKLPL